MKRQSKACLILGETVRSADLANCALQIYKETHGNTMAHRDVSITYIHTLFGKAGWVKNGNNC